MKRALSLLAIALALPGCQPRSRQLMILLPSDILSLNPNEEVEAVTDSVLFNVYEPLVGLDEDLKVRTILAESWDHPSPERWRFRLRPNVRFHDGTVVTAEMVRDALLGLREAPHLEAAAFFNQVLDVVAVDHVTLVVITREPRSILASLPFLYITKPNAPKAFPPLLGTGPYQIRQWTPKQRVVLESWRGYWGSAPEFSRVVFLPVGDADRRLTILQGGQTDIAYGMTPELAAQQRPGVRFVRRAGLTVFYLGFNLRRAPGNPFSDPRVRRAFHQALNREEILGRALKGTGSVPTQPVAPLVFGYHPGIRPPRYDPVESRRLLDQAGFAGRLRVRLDVPTQRLPVAQLIQEQLDRIGVSLELNALDKEAVYELAKAGKSDLYFAGWDCSTGEASEFYEFCLHTPAAGYGVGNYGGYSNLRVDEIAETNAAILDQRRRQAALQEAASIVMEELPLLPLYVEDDIYGIREGLTFQPRADGEIRLLDVRSFRP